MFCCNEPLVEIFLCRNLLNRKLYMPRAYCYMKSTQILCNWSAPSLRSEQKRRCSGLVIYAKDDFLIVAKLTVTEEAMLKPFCPYLQCFSLRVNFKLCLPGWPGRSLLRLRNWSTPSLGQGYTVFHHEVYGGRNFRFPQTMLKCRIRYYGYRFYGQILKVDLLKR